MNEKNQYATDLYQIICVRHGQSEHNLLLENRKKEKSEAGPLAEVQGDFPATFDVPLTEKGRKEAEDAIEYLDDVVDSIYISPHIRTKETASILMEKKAYTNSPIEDERLVEYSRGTLRSKSPEEIKEILGVDPMKLENDCTYDYREYEGESWMDVMERTASFLRTLLESEDNKTLVVTSNGVIKMVYKIMIGHIVPHIAINIRARTGSVHVINSSRAELAVALERTEEFLEKAK